MAAQEKVMPELFRGGTWQMAGVEGKVLCKFEQEC